MTAYLYIATAIGLYIAAQTDNNWEIVSQFLTEKTLTSIVVSGSTIVAGTPEGLWRSADNGKSWEKANQNHSVRHVRWLAGSRAVSPIILAGMEPAEIFVSYDGAKSWHSDAGVGRLREAKGWLLPYSPNAGCVRGFAIAKAGPHPNRLYAAVEVGGVLISDNFGKSWQLATGSDGNPDFYRDLGKMIHPDVHSITVDPFTSKLVTAATGGGIYRSTDGGGSWENIYPSYVRAVWVDPTDPQHIVAGPADGVAKNGRIEVTRDGGRTWKAASKGLQTPWPRHMVSRFVQAKENLFAVLSNGELWFRRPKVNAWQQVLPDIAHVNAVAARE